MIWPVTVFGGHSLLGQCRNEKVRPKTVRAAHKKVSPDLKLGLVWEDGIEW